MKISWLPISLRDGLRCSLSPRPAISIPLRQRAYLNSPKQLSTSRQLREGIAAPEIRFKEPSAKETEEDGQDTVFFARLVPESPSYFSGQPVFIDDLLGLQNILRKFINLPTVEPIDAPRVAWQTLTEYRNTCGENVRASKYHDIVEILKRLNQIHPSLMPADVTATMNRYKRHINPFHNRPSAPGVDASGKGLGHGRRKSSTAQAWLIEGTGEVLINGKTLAEAFGRIHDRESAIWALKATDRIDKYNVWAHASGGGTTGQAEALTLAVAKALLAHEPGLKPALRRAGCITRDPRRVERKKPGHVKARKMPAWVKR